MRPGEVGDAMCPQLAASDRLAGVQDRGEVHRTFDHAEYVPKLRAGPGICAGQSDFRTGLENRYGVVTLIVGSNPTPSALVSETVSGLLR
jgi:hypothetical protein